MRATHGGGLEVYIDDEDGKTLARNIIPPDPPQWDAAIDAIPDDCAALEHGGDERERWWLGPPESRWGTGLEAAERGDPEPE